ncbi:hypothetical protein BU26DRAFT_557526 [Trematosphaeria pertusa]|uniref:Uncharacterized protein n=1 Tax=Trematosphaeria pertusa TaxID=390896 RepID=A0A6A6J1I3_9PLEO|nr:uncharacterized protein BU26DRAFT_557526 [Trematosphaeria pertusa]KAF2256052.1 hypothetical protein BU26DRAFT_557526 [Trematosphaeria pertusa]
MEGLDQDQVGHITNLKNLIISQAQALWGPGFSYNDGRFDVIFSQRGDEYVVQLIVYALENGFSSWELLMDGRAGDEFCAAMEALWGKIQTKISEIPELSQGETYGGKPEHR